MRPVPLSSRATGRNSSATTASALSARHRSAYGSSTVQRGRGSLNGQDCDTARRGLTRTVCVFVEEQRIERLAHDEPVRECGVAIEQNARAVQADSSP